MNATMHMTKSKNSSQPDILARLLLVAQTYGTAGLKT